MSLSTAIQYHDWEDVKVSVRIHFLCRYCFVFGDYDGKNICKKCNTSKYIYTTHRLEITSVKF